MAAKNEFGTPEDNQKGFRRTALAGASCTYQLLQAPPGALANSGGGETGPLVAHATGHVTGGEHLRYEF